MKPILVSIALLAALTNTCLAEPNVDVIEYYGTTFRIPVPEGFVRFDKTYPQVAEPIRRALNISSDLLCAYAKEQEILDRDSGKTSHFKILFQASASTDMRTVNATPEIFGQIKQHLQSTALNFQGMADKAAEAVNDYLKNEQNTPEALRINQPHIIETFDDRPDSICLTVVANVQIATNEKTENFAVLSAIAVLNLQGKVISISCGGEYHDAETINAIKSGLTNWRDQVIKLNSGNSGPSPTADSGARAKFRLNPVQ